MVKLGKTMDGYELGYVADLEDQIRQLKATLGEAWWEENHDKEHLKMFPKARFWCHFCRQSGYFPSFINHASRCALVVNDVLKEMLK